ncbi:MAG: dimethyl sulfoxide reductase anchor subunit [Gammaproteobacteria bacterium]|nr:dimethyl sulfoxide reductase anchor subunit [Gammaproteobacteria bacterium]
MHPAFSVIFLTTLIGVGQGIFLALFTGQSYSAVELLPTQHSANFYGNGAIIALLFLIGGLIASFFHLGHPERAWRAASQWRTSWLSREVIALPILMGLVFIYGVMHHMGWDSILLTTDKGAKLSLTLIVATLGMLATFALFLCTGMIYACLKFLQEWYSPLTVINYTLYGTASGFLLMTAFANVSAPDLMSFYGIWSMIIIIAVFITRFASLVRNARIKYKSTMQTALGVRHTKIQQKAMGFMGGSVNTRDFFHHTSLMFMRNMKWIFMLLVGPIPFVLLWIGMESQSTSTLLTAFVVMYIGLIAERWFFFAQANHPQNLYYQTV